MKTKNFFLSTIFAVSFCTGLVAQEVINHGDHTHPATSTNSAVTTHPTTTTPATAVNPTATDQANVNPTPTPGGGVFTWSESTYNFGFIEQGNPVTHKFTFTNSGTEPIKITEVKRTCGCTALEWSKEDIAVGASGWIEATFNAASPGPFNKTIYVISNATETNLPLVFKGEVGKKEEMNFNNNTMMNNNGGN